MINCALCLGQARKRADAAFIEVADKDGQLAMEAESSETQRLRAIYEEMASFARHSKYREMEEEMNSPDFNMPIDYQDDAGNTLLHVSAQNGLKRIAKLLLRRGATINKQNMSGQTVRERLHVGRLNCARVAVETISLCCAQLIFSACQVLHYAQAYGFEELFDYFMSKGADDSLKNSDGLTCYEGLGMGDVQGI